MSTLLELAEKYKSDKLYSHSYIPFYSELFDPIRHSVQRMMEVGIGYRSLMEPFTPEFIPGSGLRMWNHYFEYAQIIGVDNNQETMYAGAQRIFTYLCDQSKPKDLWFLLQNGTYDVIIDDGSHQTEHQIITAAALVPYCTRYYVIEDCQEPERLQDALGGTIHRFTKRPDDCLLVIRK